MVLVMLLALGLGLQAQAADRDKLRAFLEVTGFDVALDSIALSAESAPQLLGMEADQFGYQWTRLSRQVFDTDLMRSMALEILERGLSDDLLAHAAGFYASDLGQRLVAAENRAHMEPDDDATRAEGETLLSKMRAENSPRLDYLTRMNAAIDASGGSVRAVQEIQIRFLLAASAAGVVELRLDEDELRAMVRASEAEMRTSMDASALANSARTYRDFSDADVLAYTEALEDQQMQEVYDLMNAIQWEIMADRFEALAVRMADLTPGQDL